MSPTSQTNPGSFFYVIKNVRQLISKHRVSKIVSSVWWRVVQTE